MASKRKLMDQGTRKRFLEEARKRLKELENYEFTDVQDTIAKFKKKREVTTRTDLVDVIKMLMDKIVIGEHEMMLRSAMEFIKEECISDYRRGPTYPDESTFFFVLAKTVDADAFIKVIPKLAEFVDEKITLK